MFTISKINAAMFGFAIVCALVSAGLLVSSPTSPFFLYHPIAPAAAQAAPSQEQVIQQREENILRITRAKLEDAKNRLENGADSSALQQLGNIREVAETATAYQRLCELWAAKQMSISTVWQTNSAALWKTCEEKFANPLTNSNQ